MGHVHCRRWCVEVCSGDLYIERSMEIFFHGHFSVAWMGSRSTFVLCTALPLLSGFRAIRDVQSHSRRGKEMYAVLVAHAY